LHGFENHGKAESKKRITNAIQVTKFFIGLVATLIIGAILANQQSFITCSTLYGFNLIAMLGLEFFSGWFNSSVVFRF